MSDAQKKTRPISINKRLVWRALKEARAVIDAPERWHKGSLAMSVKFMYHGAMLGGNACAVNASNAAAWCAVGACVRTAGCYSELTEPQRYRLHCRMIDVLNENLPSNGPALAPFNDRPETTHDEIMAVFDRAIDSLKESKRS